MYLETQHTIAMVMTHSPDFQQHKTRLAMSLGTSYWALGHMGTGETAISGAPCYPDQLDTHKIHKQAHVDDQ